LEKITQLHDTEEIKRSLLPAAVSCFVLCF